MTVMAKRKSEAPLPENKRSRSDNIKDPPDDIIEEVSSESLQEYVFSIEEMCTHIYSYLKLRDLMRISFSSKRMTDRLTYQHVISLAMVQSSHSKTTVERIAQQAELIYVPSPQRLLRLTNGKRCERCRENKVNHVFGNSGLFLCQECTVGTNKATEYHVWKQKEKPPCLEFVPHHYLAVNQHWVFKNEAWKMSAAEAEKKMNATAGSEMLGPLFLEKDLQEVLTAEPEKKMHATADSEMFGSLFPEKDLQEVLGAEPEKKMPATAGPLLSENDVQEVFMKLTAEPEQKMPATVGREMFGPLFSDLQKLFDVVTAETEKMVHATGAGEMSDPLLLENDVQKVSTAEPEKKMPATVGGEIYGPLLLDEDLKNHKFETDPLEKLLRQRRTLDPNRQHTARIKELYQDSVDLAKQCQDERDIVRKAKLSKTIAKKKLKIQKIVVDLSRLLGKHPWKGLILSNAEWQNYSGSAHTKHPLFRFRSQNLQNLMLPYILVPRRAGRAALQSVADQILDTFSLLRDNGIYNFGFFATKNPFERAMRRKLVASIPLEQRIKRLFNEYLDDYKRDRLRKHLQTKDITAIFNKVFEIFTSAWSCPNPALSCILSTTSVAVNRRPLAEALARGMWRWQYSTNYFAHRERFQYCCSHFPTLYESALQLIALFNLDQDTSKVNVARILYRVADDKLGKFIVPLLNSNLDAAWKRAVWMSSRS